MFEKAQLILADFMTFSRIFEKTPKRNKAFLLNDFFPDCMKLRFKFYLMDNTYKFVIT